MRCFWPRQFRLIWSIVHLHYTFSFLAHILGYRRGCVSSIMGDSEGSPREERSHHTSTHDNPGNDAGLPSLPSLPSIPADTKPQKVRHLFPRSRCCPPLQVHYLLSTKPVLLFVRIIIHTALYLYISGINVNIFFVPRAAKDHVVHYE